MLPAMADNRASEQRAAGRAEQPGGRGGGRGQRAGGVAEAVLKKQRPGGHGGADEWACNATLGKPSTRW